MEVRRKKYRFFLATNLGWRSANAINTVQSTSQLCKICCIIRYVFSAVHMILLPESKAFFVFANKSCLRHQSVTPFLSGTPPPAKHPGSAPGNHGERQHFTHAPLIG